LHLHGIILFINGEWIETTPEHPFYTLEEGWIPADELETGMHIRNAEGDYELVWLKWNIEKDQEMYNFTVDTAHTYFVGDGQWLVHNECGPYRIEGGHHIHAQSVFRGDPNYDPDEALSISNELMNANGWSHVNMTNRQRLLFNNLAESGLPNTMSVQNEIAYEALIAGGVSSSTAKSLVEQSALNLLQQGVRKPNRIPWNTPK